MKVVAQSAFLCGGIFGGSLALVYIKSPDSGKYFFGSKWHEWQHAYDGFLNFCPNELAVVDTVVFEDDRYGEKICHETKRVFGLVCSRCGFVSECSDSFGQHVFANEDQYKRAHRFRPWTIRSKLPSEMQ